MQRGFVKFLIPLSQMAVVTKSLTICYWNANGVKRDQDILIEFLEEYDIDILLINETHLSANKKFNMRNYCTYRNDGPRSPHGGTAILIKSTIQHKPLPTPVFINLEATFVEIPINNTFLQLGSIYCSPSLQLLVSDLHILHSMSRNYIYAGDFNAKNINWNSSISTARGKLLEDHATQHNYNIIAPNLPTHFPYNNGRPDVLDIAVLNTTLVPLHIESISALTSDHNPVILILDHSPISTAIKRNMYKDINWNAYRGYLDNSIPGNVKLETREELDVAVEMYINTVKFAMKTATKIYNSVTHAKPDPEIKQLCKQKRKARKKWQKTRNLDDKTIYNNLKNQLHRKANAIKIDKFEADVRHAGSSNNIWRITKRLTKPSQNISAQPIETPSGFKYCPSEKAEVLADYVTELFRDPSINSVENDNDNIQVDFNNLEDKIIPHTTPSEVKAIIKSLSSSKSPGPDGINNLFLKNLPHKAVCHLTKIYNFVLRLQHFPIKWKHAHIIMIPKNKKNPSLPKNRRPISLLDTHGKVLEKIILKRILPYTVNTIPPWQTAFQKGKCINHNLLALVEDITKGFNTQSYTAAMFLDISKAFDRVWHNGLIFKLSNFMPKSLTLLVASFLQNRSFQISIDGALSRICEATSGVPQGSVLGPYLYCLYTADIPTTNVTKTLMYADDTVIYSQSQNPCFAVSKVQYHINLLIQWFQRWHILVNQDKCQAIIFSRCHKRPRENLHINDHQIQFTNHVKYLGVNLDQKLLWHHHIQLTRAKAAGRTHLLFPLLKSPVLSMKKKVVLYKLLIQPLLTYAAPAWCYVPKSIFNQLQVAQNKVLKIIHGSDWYTKIIQIHEDLNISFLKTTIRKQVQNFYDKIEKSDDPFVNKLGQYNVRAYSHHRTPKSFLVE